jgi:hypothetical protein
MDAIDRDLGGYVKGKFGRVSLQKVCPNLAATAFVSADPFMKGCVLAFLNKTGYCLGSLPEGTNARMAKDFPRNT